MRRRSSIEARPAASRAAAGSRICRTSTRSRMTSPPRPTSECQRRMSESKTFQKSVCRTRVPIFWRMSTRPFAASTRMPSRTDVRDTAYSTASSASFGSRSPGR